MAAGAPAWFGKLAALGDFAQRRAAPHWLSTCEPWLSASMEAGQQALRGRWLQAYLTAPTLRYAWAPGVVDAQWWFGLLMPSCDSVGRYFPLLIAQPRAHTPADRIALDHLELWYEHIERAARQTLRGGGDSLEDFEDDLHDAPPWPTPGSAAARVVPTDAGIERWCSSRAVPLALGVHALAGVGLAKRLDGHTLWWRVAKAEQDSLIDIVHGLPTATQFVALVTSVDSG